MNPAATKRLRDAHDSASAIQEWVTRLTFAEYASDLQVRSAVERQLEIIGEALNNALRSDPALDLAFPTLRSWVAQRNVIAHLYDRVSDDLLWISASEEIPELISILNELLDATEGNGAR